MRIALLYKCFTKDDFERAELSIERFKRLNTKNEYEYIIAYPLDLECQNNIQYVALNGYNYLMYLSSILSQDYDLVILSDPNVYHHSSIEDLLDNLKNSDEPWQIAGGVDFSPTKIVTTGSNDLTVSTKFCIINTDYAYSFIDEYFISTISEDEEVDEDFINSLISEKSDEFYALQDLIINSLNINKIVLDEIVHPLSLSIDDVTNGLVYCLNKIEKPQDPEMGYEIYNNYCYVPELNDFSKSINISDNFKFALNQLALIVSSMDLKTKYKMERLEGLVALKELKIEVHPSDSL